MKVFIKIIAVIMIIVSLFSLYKTISGIIEKSGKTAEDISSVDEATYKSSCQTIDYSELARNPEKHKGEKLKFTGYVAQVIEPTFSSGATEIRVQVTPVKNTYVEEYNEEMKEYGDEYTIEYDGKPVYWEDEILMTIHLEQGADKILQEDIITFWGECSGSYSGYTVFGAKTTMPQIDALFYEIEE